MTYSIISQQKGYDMKDFSELFQMKIIITYVQKNLKTKVNYLCTSKRNQ